MINENEAVTILSDYLISQGYIINQQLDTKTKGIDIIAQKEKKKLYYKRKTELNSYAWIFRRLISDMEKSSDFKENFGRN